MTSRMKSAPASVAGYVVLIVVLTAGAAQSLSGSNTVFSDDIVDGTIGTPDLKAGAVSGSRILDNSVTAADIAPNAVGASEVVTDAVGAAEVDDGSLTLDDVAIAESGNITTSLQLNANTCTTISTYLPGAVVGDLAIVVLRSASIGTFWEGLRVTSDGQFPLRACNTTDADITSATSTIDVFTVRP